MKGNFLKYIKKRFPPLFFIPIILVFYLSFHLYSQTFKENILISIETLIGFLIVFLIFFHIRILDDIKDFRKSNFYKKNSLKKYLIAIISIEIILVAILGLYILLFYLILLVFSIGISYDFFIKKVLTKNILIKNFTHQFMIVLIGIFIFIIGHKNILNINNYYLIFCFNMFLIFALFEFSRKIKNKNKEDFSESYNYMFGKKNFSILVLIMVFLIWFLTVVSFSSINYNIILISESIMALILIVATLFYFKNRLQEKLLKKICFLYLFLTLLIMIFTSVYMKNIILKTGTLVGI